MGHDAHHVHQRVSGGLRTRMSSCGHLCGRLADLLSAELVVVCCGRSLSVQVGRTRIWLVSVLVIGSSPDYCMRDGVA